MQETLLADAPLRPRTRLPRTRLPRTRPQARPAKAKPDEAKSSPAKPKHGDAKHKQEVIAQGYCFVTVPIQKLHGPIAWVHACRNLQHGLKQKKHEAYNHTPQQENMCWAFENHSTGLQLGRPTEMFCT